MATNVTTKPRICNRCGQEYQPASNFQKYCIECGSKVPCERAVGWNVAHPERKRATDKRWCSRHPEQVQERARLRWLNHLEHDGVLHKEWYLTHSAERRLSHNKSKAKRRILGFIPMNSPFPGSEGHHLDNDHVLYIPRELNQKNKHNVFTGRNMEKINTLATQWWMSQVMRTGHTLLVGG